MPTYLLAHDLGTTGNKAALFDEQGQLIASAFRPYSTAYPRAGWAEQNPDDWWQAVVESTRELLERTPEAASHLAAVGFSGMMNGCLLVDSKGEALRPALIHADIRSVPQCSRIAAEVGLERGCRLTGNRIAPYFTLGKLAWLVEQEPDTLRKARWCVQTKDYIVGRLTGVWGVTDRSDASLTGCFDLERGIWSEEMISAGGFPQRLLPEVHPSAAIIGHVTAEASAATGLPHGLPVVLGGGDGACATAGAGAIKAGDAYHYLGGTSWVAAVTEGYRPDPTGRVSVFCGLDPSQYVVYGTVQSAGSSVDWFLDAIGVGEKEAGEDDHAALERLAGDATPGSRSLFFLPYLMGERSPLWDPHARGVYFGLSPSHRRPELARSVLEGVAYAMASNLDVLQEMGLAPAQVSALGGGMRSPLWRRIFAAVYNRPLVPLLRLAEAPSCGAAMAAGVAIGLFPDYPSAAPLFAPTGPEELPDLEMAAVYARSRPFFNGLYGALKEQFAASGI